MKNTEGVAVGIRAQGHKRQSRSKEYGRIRRSDCDRGQLWQGQARRLIPLGGGQGRTIVDAASQQHTAIIQQSGTVPGATGRERLAHSEASGLWIEQFGCRIRVTYCRAAVVASRDEHLTIREQGGRLGKTGEAQAARWLE